MTYPVFPEGLHGFSIIKKPSFSTIVQTTRAGREVGRYQNLFPLWEFELRVESMQEQTQNSAAYAQFVGQTQFQQLSQLFVACAGQFGRFYFKDTSDSSREGQIIGLGDGAETEFILVRTLNDVANGISFTEPVGGVNTDETMIVYLDGVVLPSTDWDISSDLTTLIFDSPPGDNVQITVDFHYYYLCRFIIDELNFEQFLYSHWAAEGIRFRSLNPHGLSVPGWIDSDPLEPPPQPEPPVIPACDALQSDSFAVCMGPNGRLWNNAPTNVPANAPLGVFAIWYNNDFTSEFSETRFIMANVSSNVVHANLIVGFSPGQLRLSMGYAALPSAVLGSNGTFGNVTRGSWHHAIFSWNTLANVLQFVFDGVLWTSTVGFNKQTIPVGNVRYSEIVQFGPNAASNINLPTNVWNHGTYSDVFFGVPNTFFDLTVDANVRKLYDNGPVDVSGDPASVLGVTPFICLHGSQDDYHVNYGNGGNMTSLGTPDCFNFNISPYD